MRISIITPSFNQGEFIEDTIQSVLRQDYGDVEHIVIDGGSTDSTVDILRKYDHVNWVSEKDKGQGNAINKGFARATGDVLAWLNSDDFYEERIFGKVMKYFLDHPECKFVYGDITFVDIQRRPLRTYSGGTVSYEGLIADPDIVRQPSSFWRREVVESLGGVREDLHLVMDLEFFLRIGASYPMHYLPGNLSYFRHYDQSKSSSMVHRQAVEIVRVWQEHHLGFTVALIKILARKYLRLVLGTAWVAPITRALKWLRP